MKNAEFWENLAEKSDQTNQQHSFVCKGKNQ